MCFPQGLCGKDHPWLGHKLSQKKKNSTSGHWAIGGMHPDPGYIQILTMLTEPPIQMEPLFSQEGARLVMERVVTLVAALVSPARGTIYKAKII